MKTVSCSYRTIRVVSPNMLDPSQRKRKTHNSNSVFSRKQFRVTQICHFSALSMTEIKKIDTFISVLYYVSCIIIACPIFGTRVQHFRHTKHVDHYMEFGDHCDKNNLQ